MRPQIVRLRADVACFQEVHGQERPGQPRALLALAELLAGTNLAGAHWSAPNRQRRGVRRAQHGRGHHLPVLGTHSCPTTWSTSPPTGD